MATTSASVLENSTIGLNGSLSNITTRRLPAVNPTTAALTTAYEVLSVGLIVIVMLAIGCTMTWESVKKHLKRPTGVAVGFLCQFIILPPVGFGLAHALQLPTYQAIGVILVCSCPGGSVSNMITFWVGGDVSLSVVMTAGSTLLATGMMPLNLFIYTRSWTSTAAVIPFVNILITLVSLLIPVTVGMIIRWKLPKVAKVAEIVINILGLFTIAVLVIILSILYPFVYLSSWQMYIAATVIPLLGFFIGFILSKVFCMSYQYARTVAIETGCQQVALCLALIILTFKANQRVLAELIRFPLLFGIASFVEGAVVAFIYKVVKCCCLPDDTPEEDVKEEGGGGGDADKAVFTS